MFSQYFFRGEAYSVIDAVIEKCFIRFILQRVGDKGRNYLIISERKGEGRT